MHKNLKKVSLDNALKALLSKYKKEEIDYYKKITNDIERYQTQYMKKVCNTITIQENNNGQ